MTQLQAPKSAAQLKYEGLTSEIQKELDKLKVKLQKHKSSQKKNPKNWGYTGDVAHILEQLQNINEFLNP